MAAYGPGCPVCRDRECPGCQDYDREKILLTRDMFALIDEKDFDWLNQWKWYAHDTKKAFYAARRNGKTFIYMHRLIIDCPPGKLVDHIDGNGLNNRRKNIRIADFHQNNFNRKKIDNCSSKYIGVYLNRLKNKWVSQIKINGKQKSLGYFDSQEEAAKVRDGEAKKYHAEFAHLNF